MGKINELSQLVNELNQCCKTLISISESLASLFSSQEEAPPEKPKAITLEEVRSVLAEKSRAGHTSKVRELLEKYGATKLSEIEPSQYPSLLVEAEVLGNG